MLLSNATGLFYYKFEIVLRIRSCGPWNLSMT